MAATTPLERWVEECAAMTRPDRIVWCDGSAEEYQRLVEGMVAKGTMTRLDAASHPNSYLSRSDPSDVARTEHLTYICTRTKDEAGPTNNWMDPTEAKAMVGKLFEGAMRGRTMYVVPYLMGTPGSPHAKVGVELTDSPYVVANMYIMTHMGRVALDHLGDSDDFFPGLHSVGDLSPDRRFIMHFPEERLVWSIGSGYGGNALLGKKCLSLRLASWMARKEGWLAEHMMILGLQDPSGEVTDMAGAFPSACGKTNLAMLVSPLAKQGYRVWTVGDDICWMRVGEDGRLWAVNPENGFFGVAPGTNTQTNPNAMASLARNSIFTNVGLTPDQRPWWKDIDPGQDEPPAGTLDWHGEVWQPGKGDVAHPNSRFTAPASQCPSISPHWQDPQGVPISVIMFGGRRTRVAPLVYQARDWEHGVFVGASMASETTAAATGQVGKIRRDPMAMLPFCGYNMGDYFGHWLEMGQRIPKPPAIFHVNWFRKDAEGKFLWPGFGQNVRVLRWMLERVRGTADATETAIGFVPTPASLDLEGLNLAPETVHQLLTVEPADWRKDYQHLGEFLKPFGSHLPAGIQRQYDALGERLGLTAAKA